LDDTDRKILKMLQDQGRTRRTELAGAVEMTLPSVSDRLSKLEESGVIIGYHARLDAKKLGIDITAFIRVTIDSSKHYKSFLDHAARTNDIQEVHAVTGEGTHMLKIRTRNTESLEKLLATVQAWAGVIRTDTSFVLSTPKDIDSLDF